MSLSLPALHQELPTWALVNELTLVAILQVSCAEGTLIFAVAISLSRSQLRGEVRSSVDSQFKGIHTVPPGGVKHQVVGAPLRFRWWESL